MKKRNPIILEDKISKKLKNLVDYDCNYLLSFERNGDVRVHEIDISVLELEDAFHQSQLRLHIAELERQLEFRDHEIELLKEQLENDTLNLNITFENEDV